MTWTWDASDINGNLAKVRLLVGDTVSARQLLSDESINFFTGQAGNIYGAAALACEAIAASFAGESDKSVGDLSLKLSQKAIAYEVRAKSFKKQSRTLVTPVAGGISIAAKDTQRNDTDRVKPKFTRTQFENPGSIQDGRLSDFTGEDS